MAEQIVNIGKVHINLNSYELKNAKTLEDVEALKIFSHYENEEKEKGFNEDLFKEVAKNNGIELSDEEPEES